MNPTMEKFGYPDTLIREYAHWCVLLRPKQATLGALVLACRDDAQTWPEISPAAFAELQPVTADLEAALTAAFAHDRINYLMLMMVDPDVHFHVLPRYGREVELAGATFTDPGWPGPPQIAHANETDDTLNRRIAERLREHWPGTAGR